MSDSSTPGEPASWTCPHARDARSGCAACYQDSVDPDPALPMWQVAAWFTAIRPIPVKIIRDIRRHGRHFTLAQPSASLFYLLTGHAPARDAAQAIAGLIGFLLHSGYPADVFTVTDTRAVPLPATHTPDP